MLERTTSPWCTWGRTTQVLGTMGGLLTAECRTSTPPAPTAGLGTSPLAYCYAAATPATRTGHQIHGTQAGCTPVYTTESLCVPWDVYITSYFCRMKNEYTINHYKLMDISTNSPSRMEDDHTTSCCHQSPPAGSREERLHCQPQGRVT